jgi:hypothetical protein
LTSAPTAFEADQQPDAERDRETRDQLLEVHGRFHVQAVLGAIGSSVQIKQTD